MMDFLKKLASRKAMMISNFPGILNSPILSGSMNTSRNLRILSNSFRMKNSINSMAPISQKGYYYMENLVLEKPCLPKDWQQRLEWSFTTKQGANSRVNTEVREAIMSRSFSPKQGRTGLRLSSLTRSMRLDRREHSISKMILWTNCWLSWMGSKKIAKLLWLEQQIESTLWTRLYWDLADLIKLFKFHFLGERADLIYLPIIWRKSRAVIF